MKYFEEKENEKGLTPGERLGVLIDRERLTQTAVGEMCGVSPQYVNNIVRRGQRITEDFAARLAVVLDVNLNWLFTGDGTMFRPDEVPERAEEGEEGEDGSAIGLLRDAAIALRNAADELERIESRQ